MVSTQKAATGCPRCHAAWDEIGPDGGRCPGHGFITRAEIDAARVAARSLPTTASPIAVFGGDGGAPGSPEHLTDLGNAERMVTRHGENLHYCFPWRRWFAWDGRRWAEDESGQVARAAKQTIRSLLSEAATIEESGRRGTLARHALRSEAAGRLQAMMELAQSESGIPVLPDELDADPWTLNLGNGTLDLRTGRLREHRRADLITKLAPVDFNPTASCPRWLAFLDRIFAGNQEIIAFVQRLAGYALTGDIHEHVLTIFHGPGANGKTTLCETLLNLWGDYGGPAAPDL